MSKTYPRTHVVWPDDKQMESYKAKVKKDGYTLSKGMVKLAELYVDGVINLPRIEDVK